LEHIPDLGDGTDDRLWPEDDGGHPTARQYTAWRLMVTTEMLARCIKNRVKKVLRNTAEKVIMTTTLAKEIIASILNAMVHNRLFWEETTKGM
jgi:hypothetical protein